MSGACNSRVILPQAFELSMLQSTTATNPDPMWVVGTYALGEKVVRANAQAQAGVLGYAGEFRVYESLIAANTATPGEDANAWQDTGPANTVAMFNFVIGQKTRRDGSLSVVIKPRIFATTFALFGLEGDALTITTRNAVGDILDLREYSLSGREITNLFEYLWTPFEQTTRILADGIPCFLGCTVTIDLTGATCAIGALRFGRDFELGESPQLGIGWSLSEYLGVDRDEFGSLIDVRPDGPYSENIDSVVAWVPTARLASVKRALVSLRSVPTVWILSAGVDAYDEMLLVLAIADSPQLVVQFNSHSALNISLISVT